MPMAQFSLNLVDHCSPRSTNEVNRWPIHHEWSPHLGRWTTARLVQGRPVRSAWTRQLWATPHPARLTATPQEPPSCALSQTLFFHPPPPPHTHTLTGLRFDSIALRRIHSLPTFTHSLIPLTGLHSLTASQLPHAVSLQQRTLDTCRPHFITTRTSKSLFDPLTNRTRTSQEESIRQLRQNEELWNHRPLRRRRQRHPNGCPPRTPAPPPAEA